MSTVNTSTPSLMEAAHQVAKLAGDAALIHFRQGIAVDIKGDGTPVTAADREAETLARQWIEKRFPDDGILGEEFGEIRSSARRKWILDPIDGTKSFIRGVPLWGTLVAVTEGDHVLAGVAYFPALNEWVVAGNQQGCFWNGSRCEVSTQSDVSKSVVLATEERFREHPKRGRGWRKLAEAALVTRTWGDCYGYLLVATGRAEVMVDGVLSAWDAAAVMPIIEEAGGVFTDWTGKPTVYGGSAIATNAALARQARAFLQGGTHSGAW